MFSSNYTHGGFRFDSSVKAFIQNSPDNTERVNQILKNLRPYDSFTLGRIWTPPQADLMLESTDAGQLSKRHAQITKLKDGIQIKNISERQILTIVLPKTTSHTEQVRTTLRKNDSITLTNQEQGALVFFSITAVAFFQYNPNPEKAATKVANTSWSSLTMSFRKLLKFMQGRSSE